MRIASRDSGVAHFFFFFFLKVTFNREDPGRTAEITYASAARARDWDRMRSMFGFSLSFFLFGNP